MFGPLLDSTVVDKFYSALKELKEKGIELTFNDMFRDIDKQKHFIKIVSENDEDELFYHGIFKVSRTSPHTFARGFDVADITKKNYTSKRSRTIIKTFQRYGFKWEGTSDPVHFTAIQPTMFKTREDAVAYFQKIWKTDWESIYGDYNCTVH